MTWVPLALLALRSVYLSSNDAEFALKPQGWIVEGPWRLVTRSFADG